MEDVVIEGLAEASQQISGGDLNPFKGQNGEILSSNLERSFNGVFGKERCHKISCEYGKVACTCKHEYNNNKMHYLQLMKT